MDKEQRVVFFWIGDGANWYCLKLAEEKYLKNDYCLEDQELDIVNYLEFYNIHKYFQNNIFLNEWNQATKEEYQNKVKKLLEESYKFFWGINENNILLNLEKLEKGYEYQYKKDFWSLLTKLKIYKKIDPELLLKILKAYGHHIPFILQNKKLVFYFDEIITQFLLTYNEAWELLLQYLNKKSDEETEFYFPNSLKNSHKESIIANYIEYVSGWNLSVLQYLINLKSSKFLQLSPKIKLRAKELYKKGTKNLLKNNSITYWFQMRLSDKQDKIIEDSFKNNIHSISYSANFFDSLDFINRPLSIFYDVFEYINIQGLITLISRDSEIDTFETIFSHWHESEYKTSIAFWMKERLSLLQLQLFSWYLKNRKISIEKVVNNFIFNVLKKIPELDNIDFEIQENELKYKDRINILIPRLDLLIKQYTCFIEEGKIDFDLINIGEYAISYENIPSILDKKYFYEKDHKLTDLIYYFYSDQSRLFYIKSIEERYQNFYHLIINENLKISDFEEHQIPTLEKLIRDEILYIDETEYIKIKDSILIFIIWELYQQWVLSYYAYSDEIQKRILDLETQGFLISKKSLLSKQEADYFDYYLNRSKFINWLEIRNRIHWYKYSSEDEEYTSYLILLKLIILLLLKMGWELEVFLTKK